MVTVVKLAYQLIELSFWHMKYIEDTVNVHKYDFYIIPRRWYNENEVVVSIQSNINDDLSDQIQVRSYQPLRS